MRGAPPTRTRAPCGNEEALRTSHIFTRSRQAPPRDTPRRAGLVEHILPISDAAEGKRSLQRIRIVFQSGSQRIGNCRRPGGGEVGGDHACVGGDMGR
jgi:hypothetical protein